MTVQLGALCCLEDREVIRPLFPVPNSWIRRLIRLFLAALLLLSLEARNFSCSSEIRVLARTEWQIGYAGYWDGNESTCSCIETRRLLSCCHSPPWKTVVSAGWIRLSCEPPFKADAVCWMRQTKRPLMCLL